MRMTLILLALGALPAAALAAGGVSEQSATAQIALNTYGGYGTAVARCAAGEKPVGVGFESRGHDGALELFDLYPNGRTVLATVHSFRIEEEQSDEVEASVRCADAALTRDVVRKTNADAVEPDEARNIKVTCPPGAKAIAGGADIIDDEHEVGAVMTASRPVRNGRAWNVTVENGPGPAAITVDARALCLTGARAADVVYRTVEAQVPDRAIDSVQAGCPAGSELLGGGGGVRPDATGNMSWRASAADGRRAWRASFENFPGVPGDDHVATVAVCLR